MSPETVQRKVIKSSIGISDKTSFEAEGTIPQVICKAAAIAIKTFIDFLELDSWHAPKGLNFSIFYRIHTNCNMLFRRFKIEEGRTIL